MTTGQSLSNKMMPFHEVFWCITDATSRGSLMFICDFNRRSYGATYIVLWIFFGIFLFGDEPSEEAVLLAQIFVAALFD